MDDIEELKRALGPAARDYNETQLQHLSRELDSAAEFLLDLCVANASSKSKTKRAGPDLTEPGRVIG